MTRSGLNPAMIVDGWPIPAVRQVVLLGRGINNLSYVLEALFPLLSGRHTGESMPWI